MKNLLVGNGINIRFSGKEYTSQQIVLRILKNCDRKDFPADIIVDQPYLLKNYMGDLFFMARDISNGLHDDLAVLSAEKTFLDEFKKKYDLEFFKKARITDICFEDYFFVHDMLCRMIKAGDEHVKTSEVLRVAYIYAIYNDGKINTLYQQYPDAFVAFLREHQMVFTTNYDLNLEAATASEIIHLHGQFDKYKDVYDIDSLRNKLPDAPAKTIKIDPSHAYLYCNAITTFSGNYKEKMVKLNDVAMDGIKKAVKVYDSDAKTRTEIDSWTLSDNKIIRNMGYAIREMSAHPDYSLTDNYHWSDFEKMRGDLDILGLSPWNDYHIFAVIDSANLDSCTYYYFKEDEMEHVKDTLPELQKAGKLTFRDVKEFWANMR
jgi:hypothetical protein